VYQPDIYDLILPGTFAGDVDFYRKQARLSGGPVLELGAGTGRITIPMARDGIEVHALDLDAAMLGRLRAKLGAEPPDVRERVTIVAGDMRTFAVDTRFAQVFAPFRAFLHNVTADDRRACLARVKEHLEPRGRFVFNVFHPSLTFMAQHAGSLEGIWRWGGTFARPDGGFVVRSEANRYDTVRQVVHSHHRYEEYGPEGVLTRTSLHRLELAYVYPADLLHLLQHAGFHDVDIAGGFDGRPFTRDTDELVVIARAD
jgi:SAM-dependent methyltransferase